MKKYIPILIVSVLLLIICAGFLVACQNSRANADYLRIHIRANSDSQADQNIKYAVKDVVCEYLTNKFTNVQTKSKAKALIESELENLSAIATNYLKANGFNYTAQAKLATEEFPARSYNNLVLPSDVYDALIIELGSGDGQNWWCVVFPPLCFIAQETEGETKYISYFYELYKKITNTQN